MPVSNEVRKRNRLLQYRAILANGSIVDNPCDHCAQSNKSCVMDSKNKNCAECTRRGRKCLKQFHSEREWENLHRDQEKIASELEEAQRNWLEHSQKMQEAMSKILRLQKQQRFLKERGGRMLEHDSLLMEQLDEEDPPSAEDLRELERLADESDAAFLDAVSSDPSLTRMMNDPSFWVTFDPSAGGTVEPAGGSPSDSR